VTTRPSGISAREQKKDIRDTLFYTVKDKVTVFIALRSEVPSGRC
jgi:hypothetical protein